MTPRAALRLKLWGYGVSVLSVLLLAIPAWDKAREHPRLFACLVAGGMLSILGQVMRLVANAEAGANRR